MFAVIDRRLQMFWSGPAEDVSCQVQVLPTVASCHCYSSAAAFVAWLLCRILHTAEGAGMMLRSMVDCVREERWRVEHLTSHRWASVLCCPLQAMATLRLAITRGLVATAQGLAATVR
jgi:hypothetical protein